MFFFVSACGMTIEGIVGCIDQKPSLFFASLREFLIRDENEKIGIFTRLRRRVEKRPRNASRTRTFDQSYEFPRLCLRCDPVPRRQRRREDRCLSRHEVKGTNPLDYRPVITWPKPGTCWHGRILLPDIVSPRVIKRYFKRAPKVQATNHVFVIYLKGVNQKFSPMHL
jgi:hypothetical protein